MTTDRTESTRPGFAAPAAIRLLLILAVCACTTACAVSRPRLSPEDLESRIRVQEEGMARHLRKLVDRTVRRMEQEVEMQERGGPPAVFDILMISGGGDYGAFAAGVLEGWGEVGDAGWTRPTFDVVTGVSTGALIAPFALIGDENSYRRVLTLYENPKKDWIELRDIFFFLPGRQSFMSTAGLERDVREQIDAKTIAAIAAAERDGRTLAIGATNLDLGRMHPWDLTTEAARIEAGELESDRFYKVLMASAAIPALFPPVVIDDTLFVDGGTTSNILYDADLRAEGAPVQEYRRRNRGRALPKFRFWVIVNNQLGGTPQRVEPSWVSITEASVATAIRSSTIGTHRQLSLATELQRRDGIDVEFRYVAIPDEWRPPVEGAFQAETMQSLSRLGLEMGRKVESWRADLSSRPKSEGIR
jgi:adenine/guanine phosphoribosyltransferase-like PRPP-binding protein